MLACSEIEKKKILFAKAVDHVLAIYAEYAKYIIQCAEYGEYVNKYASIYTDKYAKYVEYVNKYDRIYAEICKQYVKYETTFTYMQNIKF
jgi:hypothetical protein